MARKTGKRAVRGQPPAIRRERTAAWIEWLRNYATVWLCRDIRIGGGRQQIMIQRKQRQLQAAADPQLIEDVGQVALHGFFTDAEGLRNVLVGRSLGDQGDDLKFAAGEAEGLARRRRRW